MRLHILLTFVILALLVSGCSGPANKTSQVASTQTSAGSPIAPPAATARSTAIQPASPTSTSPPVPPASATPTAVSAPPATAVPTTTTLAPTATPDPRPESQAVDLPDLDARYRLDITELDVAAGFVRTRETITIVAFRSPPPDHLFLQVVPAAFGFFVLDSAVAQGRDVTPEVLNDGFTLAFDLPEQTPVPYEIVVDFRLQISTEPSGWGGTSLDGDVLRLGNWFPIISNDHGFSATLDPSYTASSMFDVTLPVDAGVEFAHTGEIVATTPLDTDTTLYAIHAENVRDFCLILSPSFVVDRIDSASGVAIELFTLGAPEETRQSLLTWSARAIDRLTELLGPYPYPTFRVADAGPTMPGGVEFPGVVYINHDYPELERLIYHETAHQWLYGVVGTRTLLDGWVDEGGAEFFERGLASDFTELPVIPTGGYTLWLDSTHEELPEDSGRQWYYSIYEQGARFNYAVLEVMGWDRFWAAMRDLVATHRFGIVSAWDVLWNWQRHAPGGVDLRPLFRETFRYEWIDRLPEPAAGP